MRNILLFLTAAATLGGCSFDEGFEIYDLKGKVVLPAEAATRTTDSGNELVDDVRLIGPVYLGLFPSVENGQFTFPFPEIGPAFQQGLPGDTYPYGGTTVGDIRFACVEFLTCKVTSGRFTDFDDLVTWFNDEIDQPITDIYGEPVATGEYIRQTCYELLNFTSDDEIRITATDRNDDGAINGDDLDFTQRSDGKWEADFTIHQMEWFEGFSLWGWMDAPSQSTFRYTTCDPENGFTVNEYNQEFDGGRQYRELLNFPSLYLGAGDFVSSASPDDGAYIWDTPDDIHEIELDFMVEN
jgi:hypothetical protein